VVSQGGLRCALVDRRLGGVPNMWGKFVDREHSLIEFQHELEIAFIEPIPQDISPFLRSLPSLTLVLYLLYLLLSLMHSL
jgi:hypothetical protein